MMDEEQNWDKLSLALCWSSRKLLGIVWQGRHRQAGGSRSGSCRRLDGYKLADPPCWQALPQAQYAVARAFAFLARFFVYRGG